MKHYKLKYFKTPVILITIITFFFLSSCASSSGYDVKKIIPPDNPFSFSTAYNLPEFKALILGDIHGYNTEKLVNDTEAWNKYLEKTTKPFDSSFKHTIKILKSSRTEDIDFVIFPGDVTVNGEKKSHLLLSEILADYEKSGKKVFMVPGNHDVKNPTGRQFLKKKVKYAKSVSDAEFTEIYNDFGYSEALYRDENSLSYAAEPVPGMILVCIDSNAWQKNIYFPVRVASTDGRLKTETLRWLKKVFKSAKDAGKSIIAVQHHPFSEDVFKKPKTMSRSEKIRAIYKEYGVSLVIAAHRHKYYINSNNDVPQILAPNVSSTPENALFLKSRNSMFTVIKNPYNYSE